MEWVTVPFDVDNQQEQAKSLLAAAENEQDVQTTSDGFRVPYAVARDAGLVSELYGEGPASADLTEAQFPEPGTRGETVDAGEVQVLRNTAVESYPTPGEDDRGVADDVQVPWSKVEDGQVAVTTADDLVPPADAAAALEQALAEADVAEETPAAEPATTETAAEEQTASDDVDPSGEAPTADPAAGSAEETAAEPTTAPRKRRTVTAQQ